MIITLRQNEIEVHLKQNHKNLYWFKINLEKSNPKDLELLLQKFNNIVKEKNIEILSYDIDGYENSNSFLDKSEMKIFKKKGFYSKELANYIFKDSKLTYKPLSEYSEEYILELFSEVTKGDTDIEVDTTKEYYDMVEYAEDKLYTQKWKIVLINNEVIGMLSPQIYHDCITEGSLFYIGILPKHRGKGFGKEMHLQGLKFLKNYGANKYVGSTMVSNEAMIKIFNKNNCQKKYTQLYYK